MDTTTTVSDTIISVSGARELVRYMEWADARTWAAVTAHDASRHDADIRKLLHHVHTVQEIFLGLWIHEPPTTALAGAGSSVPELGPLQQAVRSYFGRTQRFLEEVSSAGFMERVEMPWLAEYEKKLGITFVKPTVAETIVQVVNHTTHHRGQVQARLRALGGEPQLVDYIAWVWFGKPSPEWRDE
jgi:uncharacterized damage-inducible protein DinB